MTSLETKDNILYSMCNVYCITMGVYIYLILISSFGDSGAVILDINYIHFLPDLK